MSTPALLLLPAALLGAGCALADPPMPPAPTATSSAISLDSLAYQEPHSQAIWAALRDHLLGATAGWRYSPPRRSGGTVQETWCGPSVPADVCSTGRVATQPQPGYSYAWLSQYFFADDWPKVFGVSLDAGDLPADGSWGVQVSLSLRGRNIGGDSLGLVFRRAAGGALTDRVTLGYQISYQVGETLFKVRGAGDGAAASVESDLAAYLASETSFRDTGLARLDALLAEVERGIEAHEVKRAIPGKYQGGGVPPVPTYVPLDTVEETTALARATQELGAMRRQVASDYAAMYARLVGIVARDLPLQR